MTRGAWAALVLCACVEAKTYVAPDADITISIDPALREIREGSTIQIPIAAVRGETTTGAISLSLESPPAGISAEPAQIDADATSGMLSLSAQGAPAGTKLTVTVTGSLGSGASSTTATLFVIGRPATLDTTFGVQGRLRLTLPDGLALVGAGHQGGLRLLDHAAAKVTLLDAEGQPDASFGTNGTVDYSGVFGTLQPAAGGALTRYQSDGRLVVFATYDDLSTADPIDGFLMFRLLKNGSLDRSFGTDGKAAAILRNARLTTLAVGPEDEMILFASATDASSHVLVKISAVGQVLQSREPDAGTGSIVSLAVQPDRKIVAVAYTSPSQGNLRFVTRLKSDLTIDSLFGSSGRILIGDQIPSLYPSADGGYLLAGAKLLGSAKAAALWRFDSQWRPTAGFPMEGNAYADLTGYFAGGFEDDGKIVVAASSDAARVVLLRPDGTLRSDLAPNGTLFIAYRETNDLIEPLLRSTHSRAFVIVDLFNSNQRDIYRVWY